MEHKYIERIRAIGPYVVLELALPGGTMFAFLLYLYRRKANTREMTGAAPQGTILAANP